MRLTADPIDLEPLMKAALRPDRGGLAIFVGTVRDHHAGRTVRELEYSAYHPMAEAKLADIVAEAESRWSVTVVLRHRLGLLAIGETAVAVVVAGGHRDEAFAACRHVIEELKRRVPIWKRERYTDGSEAWVDPTAPGGVASMGTAGSVE